MAHGRITLSLAAALLTLPQAPLEAQSCSAGLLAPTESISRERLCALTRRAAETHSDALYVSQFGAPVLEWHPEGAPETVHVMSVTKSVVSLAFGRLLLDGALESLDTPVSRYLPEWRQGRKADITIRHLLTHTSGLQDLPNAGVEIEVAPDVVQLAIAAELESDPGTAFQYNNKATNLLAGLVEVVSGQPMDDYLRDTVLRDLGIEGVEWIRDPSGNPYGMAGLSIGAADLARIGEMMRQGGSHGGVRVVDEAFVREATSTRHDLYARHGLLWWLIPDDGGDGWRGFYGDGWLGQWLVVLPEEGIVAVRLIDRGSWASSQDDFGDFRDAVAGLAGR